MRAIEILTLPENQEEKEWFNHLLGNDLAEFTGGKPFLKSLNKVNYHLTVGYDIEKIAKEDDVFYAHVKELRVLDVAEEGANPKYKAQMQDLTFELLNKTKTTKFKDIYK